MSEQRQTILVVDDEAGLLEVVAAYLESKGYQVLTARLGGEALALFQREAVSLVVLDLMLPDISGEEICRTIRRSSRVPIIMLTAKVQEADMLEGLDMGADDYITKPASLRQLHARIEAVLRRCGRDPMPLFRKSSYRDGDLVVDTGSGEVRKGGVPVALTPSELGILSALIKYPGKVFSREELIDIALGSEFDGYDRAVDSHIKNLRQKIEDDPRHPDYVLTVHRLGYRFGGR